MLSFPELDSEREKSSQNTSKNSSMTVEGFESSKITNEILMCELENE